MKRNKVALNSLAKTVVLGLAVLLASSAFASSKVTLQVREAFEVNGQQLPLANINCDGRARDRTSKSASCRARKKSQNSGKIVELNKAYDYDSAIVDHAGGKATVSEVRFAGKKYALAIGGTEKAEMSAGTNK